ncbi:DUF4173 domain-containing protein [Clostridium sp. BSD2780061688st1 E8]|uniref:DUF4153 domain-containing protein n=1 Tax=unclassified Clostridium TaxID=2614128 RepID=UPI001106B2D6|nr:DUF4173 domain-containing protein [Clostridium sp. BSD2780061688st1 E8]
MDNQQTLKIENGMTAPGMEGKWAKRDGVFVIAFLACAYLIVDFFLWSGFALGATVAYGVLFLVTSAYLTDRKIRPQPFPAFCGAASLAAAAVFTVNHDVGMNVLLLLMIDLLYAIFICGAAGRLSYWTGSYFLGVDLCKNLIAVPLAHLAEPLKAVLGLWRRDGGKGREVKVLLGLVLALPVVAITVPLLIQSDAAFQGLMEGLAENLGELMIKVVLAVLLGIYIAAVLCMLHRRAGERSQPGVTVREGRFRVMDGTVASVFLGAISVFYLVYLLSQLAYFFSAFAGILPEGYAFTPSEYARRGFFEMVMIALINGGVLSLSCILVKRNAKDEIPAPVKGLSFFIALFTLLLTATAFSKMVLYIQLMGMTRLRVLTSIFMVMLAIAILALIVRLFFRRFPYMRVIIVGCSLMLLCCAYADVDTMIAKNNIAAYRAGTLEQLDVLYLGRLSAATVPQLEALLEDENAAVRDDTARVMDVWASQRIVKDEAGNLVPAPYYLEFKNYTLMDQKINQVLISRYTDYAGASRSQHYLDSLYGEECF